MRKMLFAIAAAGALLAGLAAATPALAQARPITLLCSPGSNGGTRTCLHARAGALPSGPCGTPCLQAHAGRAGVSG